MLATEMSLSLTDYTVTEAGFGCDLGAEKFLDIKCRAAGLAPNAVVLVATVRALKYHGGQPLAELKTPNVEALERGIENLQKHIENVGLFNLTPVVAINRFVTDSDEELQFIKDYCTMRGVACAVANVWGEGGAGTEELARLVVEATESGRTDFQPLYPLDESVEKKIETVARGIYGADGVEYTPKAKQALKRIADLGLTGLAVCIAKTQKSLSDNPALLGRPRGFTITVRDIEIAAGAGFLVPITGEIMRMPGLPEVPAAEAIDIDDEGNISGLF